MAHFRRRGDRAAGAETAPGGRAFSSRPFRDLRVDAKAGARIDCNLLPAGARRARALAQDRCGRNLALPGRCAAAPANRGDAAGPIQDHDARTRSRGRRTSAGSRAAAGLAGGGKPRRMDAGRLHGGAGIRVRRTSSWRHQNIGRRALRRSHHRACEQRPPHEGEDGARIDHCRSCSSRSSCAIPRRDIVRCAGRLVQARSGKRSQYGIDARPSEPASGRRI